MRNLTIRKRLAQLKRRYSKVTSFKFFYNRKPELKKKYHAIFVWFLIQEPDRGYSIFPFIAQRKKFFTVREWVKLMQHPFGGYDSIYSVFTQAVLPAINNRSGSQWRFVSLIGWAGKSDIRKNNDTSKRSRRNKTPKKRISHARSRNRRRH